MKNNSNSQSASGSLHSGHRQRLKEKFLKDSGRSLADHELLELILFFAMPRVNTNPTAHSLIDKLGSLDGVLNATPEQIGSVEGAGQSTYLLMAAVSEMNRRIKLQADPVVKRYDTLSSVGSFLSNYYKGMKIEQFSAMLFDNSMRLIDFVVLSSGSVNSAPFDVRELARVALSKDAARVIISHNHPGGQSIPTTPDREVSWQAEAALMAISITLVEHIIVGDDGYTPILHSRMLSSSPSNVEDGFYKNFYEN